MSSIAVGGLGGSGTRVIAQILKECGVYLSDRLNSSLDNQFFTYLFARPQWFLKADLKTINNHLKIFEDFMIRNKLTIKSYLRFSKIFFSDIISHSTYHLRIFKRIRKRLIIGKKNQLFRIWGWKEPNTHIYLKHITNYFDDLKYIHVIRHGLDMAFSRNQNQLYNWGKVYGIKLPKNKKLVPVAQLEYWIKSTKTAIKIGEEELENSFYLLNYDDFCNNPKDNIKRLLYFLDIGVDKEIFNKLLKIPQITPTQGRWKLHDLSIFGKKQINEVVDLGFNI
jgi:hypothetical protein